MPCKHQDLGDIFDVRLDTFSPPYNYDTADLVRAVKDAISPLIIHDRRGTISTYETLINKNPDWGYFFKPDSNGNRSILALGAISLIFQAVFFIDPQSVDIFRKEAVNIDPTPEVFIAYKPVSKTATLAASVTGSRKFPEIDRAKRPSITLPSPSTPEIEFGALLGAIIDFHLRWYSCGKPDCQNDIKACGKAYRGFAWQEIAYAMETSGLMEELEKLIDGKIHLRRKEEFIRELSYWDEPEKLVSETVLEKLGWESESVSSFVDAAREEKLKRDRGNLSYW
ncbi:hypothetical protein NHQ30_010909 [Ciborinia camelliae]|nr:hypothetical protein NHQ30_010909 [Ciborinia camelliae]